jgi:hypothetical protein
MIGTVYLHADRETTATTDAQSIDGDTYAVLHLRSNGTDVALFGPTPLDTPAVRLDFARALAQAAAAFLAIEEQHAAPIPAAAAA